MPYSKKSKKEVYVMKRMIAACIVALVVSANGETFETCDNFSIPLPDGWVQIPGTVLQAYAEKVNELSPHSPRQMYDCGYQLDDDGNMGGVKRVAVVITVEMKLRRHAFFEQANL